MPRLSHTPPATVGAVIERCARALRRARVVFGHGTDNARDEAAELVFFAAGIDHARGAGAYAEPVSPRLERRVERLLRRRIAERVPLAYLTHRAFFAGLELYVDRRVLVPRSPIAELALNRFVPWVRPGRVRRVLDLGTGSGAIALACARAFPRAQVDAVDVSSAALAVCRENIRRQRLLSRVHARQSDFFARLGRRRYDIIVSNPPYVGGAEMRSLPPEYRREPRLGLAAGADGLDAVRVILAGARAHLSEEGVLVVEVGNSERRLLRAFPRLPFIWPTFERGGGGVFVLRACDLDGMT